VLPRKSLVHWSRRSLLLLLVPAAWALTVSAQYPADPLVGDVLADTRFVAATRMFERDYHRFVEDIIALTEIPAPPFGEEARGQAYLRMLREAGLSQVERDAEGNVMGVWPGARGGSGGMLAVAAHLDTVFPAGTDVVVKRFGSRLTAPGIGDNAQGLALLLAMIRAMKEAGITTTRDLLFVGNVGEEGVGDLRGVRYLFGKGRHKDRIAAFVSIDGVGGANSITNRGVGTRRYRVEFRGPGGHSYSAFGLVNPAFALAGAMQKLAGLAVPRDPKTTFNVGVVGGGTSINAIPSAAWMEVDLRSVSPVELDALDARFKAIVAQSAAEENRTRSTVEGAIAVDLKPIGARPSGTTPADSALVRTATAVVRALGLTPELSASSTDANLPMSLGIPAITIDSGLHGDRAHAPDEWIDVDQKRGTMGFRRVLGTILAAAQ
jgi:acetylornithine deacetylase/succinyl-diaminopimelate desuccinylase-like protein